MAPARGRSRGDVKEIHIDRKTMGCKAIFTVWMKIATYALEIP